MEFHIVIYSRKHQMKLLCHCCGANLCVLFQKNLLFSQKQQQQRQLNTEAQTHEEKTQ